MDKNVKLILFLALLLTSCSSQKKLLYLQDVDGMKKQPISKKAEITIHRDDILSIVVNSRNPELAVPFNVGSTSSSSTSSSAQTGYTVDSNGNIDLPVLGKIYVAGLTRIQLQDLIKDMIIEANYIKDPVVRVQFLNFKFSVLGEVTKPGSYQITGDRITLFEAISMAGDLTVYGRRDRIAIIRENDSIRTILYNDLRSSNIFNSPYYYLHQNDIVYIEPSKAKMQAIDRANLSMWITVMSFLLSVTTFTMYLSK